MHLDLSVRADDSAVCIFISPAAPLRGQGPLLPHITAMDAVQEAIVDSIMANWLLDGDGSHNASRHDQHSSPGRPADGIVG